MKIQGKQLRQREPLKSLYSDEEVGLGKKEDKSKQEPEQKKPINKIKDAPVGSKHLAVDFKVGK